MTLKQLWCSARRAHKLNWPVASSHALTAFCDRCDKRFSITYRYHVVPETHRLATWWQKVLGR
jgi:hypothetical protein